LRNNIGKIFSENEIVPLLSSNEFLDSTDVMRYVHREYTSFKLLDGFSLESHFAMEGMTNSDGTKVRFVREVGGGSPGYRGTVFLNKDGSIYYRQTTKSPNTPYAHKILKSFFSSLNNKMISNIEFQPC